MRSKDLQVQTLVNLGSLWQNIVDVKSQCGLGPGDNPASLTKLTSGKHKTSRNLRSLEKAVGREARKCSRGFARMATLVDRT